VHVNLRLTGTRLRMVAALGVLSSFSGPADVATGSPATATRASGQLELNAVLTGEWKGVPCPAGMSTNTLCGQVSAGGTVAGLGQVAESYTFYLSSGQAIHVSTPAFHPT
jgi:hypothetical protein